MATVVTHIAPWNTVRSRTRSEVVGLVPTMGALHRGHGTLLDEARRRCSIVVAIIFVNRIQFDQQSDFDLYPRVLDDDVEFCKARGVDYIFTPTSERMYPQPQRAFVEVEELANHLCGRTRPGHFRGVATVVLKLFQIVRPDVAFFGEKDYQQLTIVQRRVADLNIPVKVIAVPTEREADGLAISSRNRRLTFAERDVAPRLYEALLAARRLNALGERHAAVIREEATETLRRIREITIEYFDVVDPERLQPVEAVNGPVRAAIAAWIGETRLIDNVLCEPEPNPHSLAHLRCKEEKMGPMLERV